MSEYEVGYGKPPKHSQFKKGICSNPRGRGKCKDVKLGEIMKKVLYAEIEFRDGGKMKKASRVELAIRRLISSALKGDAASAALLLKMHAHAVHFGDSTPTILRLFGGLPSENSKLLQHS